MEAVIYHNPTCGTSRNTLTHDPSGRQSNCRSLNTYAIRLFTVGNLGRYAEKTQSEFPP